MIPDDRASLDALDRFWDEVAAGRPGVAADLDPADAVVIRRFQRLPNAAAPRRGAADRVWDRIAVGDGLRGNTVRSAVPVPLSRRTPSLLPLPPARPWFNAERRRWLSAQFAMAALLVVTFASAFVAFRGEQAGLGTTDGQPVGGTVWTIPGAANDVPMFRGNAAHTGEEPGPGPGDTPRIGWRLTADGPLTEGMAMVDGTIYANAGNTLLAIDATTGAMRWRLPVGESPLRGAPAVAGGSVFVTDTSGTIIAVDARTGVERWSRNGGLSSSGADSGSPTVAGGTVIVFDRGVSAIDAVTGAYRWHSTLVCYGAPVVSASIIYASCQDRGLHAIDLATGVDLGHLDPYRSFLSLVVIRNSVYGVEVGGPVIAIDRTDGSERWQISTLQTSLISPIASAGGRIFVVDGFDLVAVDATTGGEVWRHQIAGGVATAPVVAAGTVYVGAYDHRVFGLDAATGEERWQVAVAGSIVTEPAVVDGVVYVGDDTNTLYALGSAPANP